MMSEEDEEVLFDRETLLDSGMEITISPSRDVPQTSAPAVPHRKGRIGQTICLCAAFFGLGLCIAIPGPTLLDLQEQTNTNTEEISRIFTGRSVGYLLGSIVGGFLFDHINQSCLLSLSLFLTAIGTAAAPWCSRYLLLTAIIAFQGISMGFLDTGGNVLCLYLWGRNSGPYMQTMHFSFGLGAFVAPLIAEPFLSRSNLTNVTYWQQDNLSFKPNFLGSTMEPGNHKRFVRNIEEVTNVDPVNSTALLTTPRPKKPHVADGKFLNSDKKIADGTKVAGQLKNLNKNPGAPVSTTIASHLHWLVYNRSSESDNDMLSDTTSTTTPTLSSTPTTTTTTTTTTASLPPSTTLRPTPVLPTADGYASQLNATSSLDGENSTTLKGKHNGNLQKITDGISKVATNVSKVWQNLTKVQFAYFAIALFVLLVSVVFMCVVCCCSGGCRLRALSQEVVQEDFTIKKESTGFRVQILFLLFVFYFLYVGMEVTFGGLVMTFSVNYLHWSKAKGTLLTSVFWGSFAAGRGLAIPLSRCLTPAIMLVADLVLSTLSLIGLVIGLDSNHTMMWFCSATLGIGMASIFPTGITWAERYMHITGKTSSFFVVGSALGEMLLPMLVGFLFQNKGPMWLIYVMLGCALVSLVIYIIMQNLATNKGERYQRLSGHRRNHVNTTNGQPHLDAQYYSVGSGSEEEDSFELDSVPLINDSHTTNFKKRVTFNLRNVNENGVGNATENHHIAAGKSSILKFKPS